MKPQRTSDFKRGDTFLLTCTYKVDTVATSVTGFTIRSEIRDKFGHLVATLSASLANQGTNPGVFYLSPTVADTSDWATGDLFCDIEITNGGVIRSTITFIVPVIDDVTK